MSRSTLPAPMWDLPALDAPEGCTGCRRFDIAIERARRDGDADLIAVHERKKRAHLVQHKHTKAE
ncbi:hypothetical protein [Streptomyces luteireticuli]|uniref:DUF1289 domain-containing protein n=1 Tax=Streptomyces luteireticuli TaxID=173858 RepID=A0ABN0YIT4_9ACTN